MGDLLLAFNGQDVAGEDALFGAMRALDDGASVEFKVQRAGPAGAGGQCRLSLSCTRMLHSVHTTLLSGPLLDLSPTYGCIRPYRYP